MVADTSIPKPKNANTESQSNIRVSVLLALLTGYWTPSHLTPDDQVERKAWRAPIEGESNYAHPDSTASYVACLMCLGKRMMLDIIGREAWIKAMMLRLVRDQLNACYKDNGVNHYENCAHLSELYLKWMREGYRVRGGRLRMKVDTRKMARQPEDSRIPSDAPLNRRWRGIDGTGTTGPEESIIRG